MAEAARHFQRFRRVGIVRLAFVLLGLVLLWFVFHGLSFWWLAIPVIGFFALAPTQQRISEQRRRCERAADLYRQGLARLDDRWSGTGATGERFLNRTHLYAEDLDL